MEINTIFNNQRLPSKYQNELSELINSEIKNFISCNKSLIEDFFGDPNNRIEDITQCWMLSQRGDIDIVQLSFNFKLNIPVEVKTQLENLLNNCYYLVQKKYF